MRSVPFARANPDFIRKPVFKVMRTLFSSLPSADIINGMHVRKTLINLDAKVQAVIK